MTKPKGDANLVAFCGLYCGACRARAKRGCPGCHNNVKATWCKVRACCLEKSHATCSDCATHADPKECNKFNNIIARLFGLIFRSDRRACIHRIREIGRDAYAREMAAKGAQTIRR